MSFSVSGFARLKSKHVVGEWKYSMNLSSAVMTGSFIFSQKSGELEGEIITSLGTKSTISKIKVNKKNNTLCFEIPRENDVAIEFVLVVKDNKFNGKGWINEANFEITANKLKP